MPIEGAEAERVRGFAGLISLVSQIPSESSLSLPKRSPISDGGIQAPKDKKDVVKSDVAPLKKTASNSQPAANGKKLIVGMVLAAGSVLIWILAQVNQGKSSTPPYAPPRETSLPRSSPPPAPVPRAPTPSVYAEVAPPEGDGSRSLDLENIRWCLYQDRRIEIIRSKIARDNTGDLASFNAMVVDYNARCEAFRYRQSNMTAVRAELNLRESNLQLDAERILNGWPHRRRDLPSELQQPSPPRRSADSNIPAPQPTPNMPSATPQSSPKSPDLNAGFPPPLPPPIVVDRGVAPSEQPADSRAVPDLLRIDDAKAVQRRLTDLGYFSGPVPNGIWTSRWRRALRDFKALNRLPPDDRWDEQTNNLLFATSALKSTVANSSGKVADTTLIQESKYPPPPGATYNPLNRSDAMELQNRLAELGFLQGISDGVWGGASRTALREFKTTNGLMADDQWDASVEAALKSGQPSRSAYPFVGGWAEEIGECGSAAAGAAPLRITVEQAEMGGVMCRFGPLMREGSGWRVPAVCTGNSKTWNSSVLLSVSGDRLTWANAGETNGFVRCRGG